MTRRDAARSNRHPTRASALLAAALFGALVGAGEPVGFGRPTAPDAAAAKGEATTQRLAAFLWGSLYTDETVTVPDELRRRAGELAEMSTSLDPLTRVQGAFALAVIGRGEVLTRTAFEPVTGSPPFERANAAFLRCAVRQDCPRAVAMLRELGVELAKGKPKRVANLEAVLLLSLIAQPGYAQWVDSLGVKDPEQLEVLALAKARHALTFPGAR